MKRIFIIPILTFASFMIFLYLVLPQREIQSKAKENFLKREQDVKARQEYFEGLKKTLLEIATYQETLDRIELSMPGEVSLSDLLGFFNKKADANGLTLKSVAPFQTTIPEGGLENKEEILFQSFSLALSGSVSSFESFLKDIRSSLRLVDVESFSLQQKEAEDSPGSSSEITVQVKVYY
ncbi:MAG: type 4a pilus biogenesis protein PilO [bacterium]